MAPPNFKQLEKFLKGFFADEVVTEMNTAVKTYLFRNSFLCHDDYDEALAGANAVPRYAQELLFAYLHSRDFKFSEMGTKIDETNPLLRQIAVRTASVAHSLLMETLCETRFETKVAKPGLLKINVTLDYQYPDAVVKKSVHGRDFAKIRRIADVAKHWHLYRLFRLVKRHTLVDCCDKPHARIMAGDIPAPIQADEWICDVLQYANKALDRVKDFDPTTGKKSLCLVELERLRAIVFSLEINPVVADFAEDIFTQYLRIVVAGQDFVDQVVNALSETPDPRRVLSSSNLRLQMAAAFHVARRFIEPIDEISSLIQTALIVCEGQRTVQEVCKQTEDLKAIVSLEVLQDSVLQNWGNNAPQSFESDEIRATMARKWPYVALRDHLYTEDEGIKKLHAKTVERHGLEPQSLSMLEATRYIIIK